MIIALDQKEYKARFDPLYLQGWHRNKRSRITDCSPPDARLPGARWRLFFVSRDVEDLQPLFSGIFHRNSLPGSGIASLARHIAVVDSFITRVEIDLVFFIHGIHGRAIGVVELLGVPVAYVRRISIFRDSSRIVFSRGSRNRCVSALPQVSAAGILFCAERERIAIADTNNRPLQVSPEYSGACVTQTAESGIGRVVVRISFTDTDDTIAGHHLSKEHIGRRGIAAVVADFEDISTQVVPGIHHGVFRIPFSVACKKEAVVAVDDAHANGKVVYIAVTLSGGQELHGCAAERERFAYGRQRKFQPLLVCVFHQRGECIAIVLCDRRVNGSHRAGIQGTGQTANVVLVGVRGDHVVDVLYSQRLGQIGIDEAAVAVVAAVDHHDVIAALEDCGICLADVQEINGEVVLRYRKAGRQGD